MAQVSKEHYHFSKYTGKTRWTSYWHQLDEVLKTNSSSVLVVGVGDGIVPGIIRVMLKKAEGEVYTFDFDPALKPDYIGDLREIEHVLNGLKVDCVLCSQVLEHLEYDSVDSVLEQLSDIAKNVIISVPHGGLPLCNIIVKLPKQKRMVIGLRIPRFYKEYTFNGEHYWELGYRGYSKKRFRSLLSKYFYVDNQFHVPENPYHVFFALKSKNCAGGSTDLRR